MANSVSDPNLINGTCILEFSNYLRKVLYCQFGVTVCDIITAVFSDRLPSYNSPVPSFLVYFLVTDTSQAKLL